VRTRAEEEYENKEGEASGGKEEAGDLELEPQIYLARLIRGGSQEKLKVRHKQTQITRAAASGRIRWRQ